jgi:hypothetical protein
MEGCPIVALGADAARQGSDVKALFEAGIKAHLEILGRLIAGTGGEEPNRKTMANLSTMVGALTLSRVVNDPDLLRPFWMRRPNRSAKLSPLERMGRCLRLRGRAVSAEVKQAAIRNRVSAQD